MTVDSGSYATALQLPDDQSREGIRIKNEGAQVESENFRCNLNKIDAEKFKRLEGSIGMDCLKNSIVAFGPKGSKYLFLSVAK